MKIHFISIGGSVMHNLALALSAKGYTVTGSDDEIYEPSRSRLAAGGLLPDRMGWDASKIVKELDAVILGMHAKSDNPELLKAKALGIPVYSFPEFVYEQSKEKTRIVVTGSHGKTTTTAMIMHVLRTQGIDFDYLVGAQLDGFDLMVKLSDAPIIVVEGDEYLSSAIDRRPKFMHYHPDLAVITGVAWDHINVFKRYEDYLGQFELLIQSMQSGTKLFYCADDSRLSDLIDNTQKIVECEPYEVQKYEIGTKGSWYVIDREGQKYALKIFGEHNMQNLKAAQLVCAELGIEEGVFLESMQQFEGAAKRLELKASSQTSAYFLDFAHAPSKVRATVQAVREKYAHRHLVACLELHTYSSLNKDFLHHYAGTLNPADEAIVYYSERTIEIKRLAPITPDEMVVAFRHRNIKVFTEAEDLERYLVMKDYQNVVLLMMSSGIFGGIDLERVTHKVVNTGRLMA